MRIVFWLNILSPHQIPYIKYMAEDVRVKKVICVAADDISYKRKEMGWNVPQISKNSKMEVFINPSVATIKSLFSEAPQESWHLFSGIRGFKFVFKALKISIAYNINRGLITECPNTYAFGLANGKPLWLHKIRFCIQDRKYAKHIKKVYAIGDKANNYFSSVCSHWEVTPFSYCTEFSNIILHKNEGNLKTCFVGSLEKWKSPMSIVRVLASQSESIKNIEHKFIGKGSEYRRLIKYISEKEIKKIDFLGTINNSELNVVFSKQDLLILPSIYDGWGAVVNEALQAGLYVICSDACGASALLHDSRCGYVFKAGDLKELENHLIWCSKNVETIRSNRAFRMDWAKKSISGQSISEYMIETLLGHATNCPWLLVGRGEEDK